MSGAEIAGAILTGFGLAFAFGLIPLTQSRWPAAIALLAVGGFVLLLERIRSKPFPSSNRRGQDNDAAGGGDIPSDTSQSRHDNSHHSGWGHDSGHSGDAGGDSGADGGGH